MIHTAADIICQQTIKMRISRLPKRPVNSFANTFPMVVDFFQLLSIVDDSNLSFQITDRQFFFIDCLINSYKISVEQDANECKQWR